VTTIVIGMVLIVVVAIVVIAVFSEDDDEPTAHLPRHMEPESPLDNLLE
jgi:hypothetical protein